MKNQGRKQGNKVSLIQEEVSIREREKIRQKIWRITEKMQKEVTNCWRKSL